MITKRDIMFMNMAEVVSTQSKDPNTKVGAVLVSPNEKTVAIGWNGMVAGLNERWEDKHSHVIHAEVNAIINSKTDLSNWTLYTTMFPCHNCRNIIMQCEISRVVYKDEHSQSVTGTIEESKRIFKERGLIVERC